MKYFAPTRLSENIHKTPEGYLLCIGVPIGRTGEMVYGRGETPLEVGPNGQVIVTRDAEELFRPETIASFQGKSFTIKHPEEFVDTTSWKDLTHGILQNVRQGKTPDEDGEIPLLADILITSDIAIKSVEEDGMREVSCGYECGYIQTGDGKGKQIEIIGNHLALVDQGRAGAKYAINDHVAQETKGPKEMSKAKKLKDAVAAMFSKAKDEAFKTIDEEMKEDKSGEVEAKDESEKKDEAKDANDAMMTEMKDVLTKMKDFLDINTGKSKDADKDEKEDKSGEVEAKDDGEVSPSIEDRLKAVEAKLAALMEGESEASDEDVEEDEEEMEAEDDDAEEEVVLTGDAMDTATRAEILAPGIAITKDVKAKALKAALATKEGKVILTALNGGKTPTFDSAEKVESLFVSASEVLKARRTSELSGTKKATRDSASNAGFNGSTGMTAEEMNARNAKFYANK